MKYETIVKPKENRMVETCRMDEAFRIDKSWYVRINIHDTDIENFGDFFEMHVVCGSPGVVDFCEYLPVMHLGSQSLCYVYSKQFADEWADLKLSLLIK